MIWSAIQTWKSKKQGKNLSDYDIKKKVYVQHKKLSL